MRRSRRTRRGLRHGLLGLRPPDDQELAKVLHRRGVQLGADALQHGFAPNAIVVEHADLDELVRAQIDVDFVQDARSKPVLSDCDDRLQVMRSCAQRAPLRRRQNCHASAGKKPFNTLPYRRAATREAGVLRAASDASYEPSDGGPSSFASLAWLDLGMRFRRRVVGRTIVTDDSLQRTHRKRRTLLAADGDGNRAKGHGDTP